MTRTWTTRIPRPMAQETQVLECVQRTCPACGKALVMAYQKHRTIAGLSGRVKYLLKLRVCWNRECVRFKQALRPEAEGRLALPRSEFGLDVVAQMGGWRYGEHRSVPEMHQALLERGVQISERTVDLLLHRYEELLTLHSTDKTRLHNVFAQQGRVILALDGLQPDVGHEVLWVVREVLSGEILLARAVLGSGEAEIAPLLLEAQVLIGPGVRVEGLLSEGAHGIRHAVARVFPGVPHQLCQFHYLRAATQPLFEADRHAKVQLKKALRGFRVLERALEARQDPTARILIRYCLAIGSALTQEARPPLEPGGLRLHGQIQQIQSSLERVIKVKKGQAKRSTPS